MVFGTFNLGKFNDRMIMILILQRVMPSGLPTDSIDIAIIGGGPHALTLVTHVLEKRKQLRDRIRVFDSSGAWMSQWQRQFANYEIPHLRSRVSVHFYINDQIHVREMTSDSRSYCDRCRTEPIVVPDLRDVLDQGELTKVLAISQDTALIQTCLQDLQRSGNVSLRRHWGRDAGRPKNCSRSG